MSGRSEVGGEFETLAFTAGQAGERLAERQILQAHIAQTHQHSHDGPESNQSSASSTLICRRRRCSPRRS